MAIKQYRVISETFWDGAQLQKRGAVVDIDTDLVTVSKKSKTLEPVDADKPEKSDKK